MKENELYNPILKGGRVNQWSLFRLTDDCQGKKPFDISGLTACGRAVGMEVKLFRNLSSVSNATRFPRYLFAPHQLNWLAVYSGHGQAALTTLCDPDTREVRIYRLPQHFTGYEVFGSLQECKLRWEKQAGSQILVGWPANLSELELN